MEKTQADKFVDTVQGLINVFKKRKAERLDMVIEDSGISRLIAGVNKINDQGKSLISFCQNF